MQGYNSRGTWSPDNKAKLAPLLLKVILIALVWVCFSGCENWQLSTGNEIPKEVPANVEIQKPSSESDGEDELPKQEEISSVPANNKEHRPKAAATTSVKKISAKVFSEDKNKSWETKDEILAQNISEVLLIKNEEFYRALDLRPYDFIVVITDREENEEQYHIWVNFIKENEIIVEDSHANQWSLTLMDSHALRKILQSLK